MGRLGRRLVAARLGSRRRNHIAIDGTHGRLHPRPAREWHIGRRIESSRRRRIGLRRRRLVLCPDRKGRTRQPNEQCRTGAYPKKHHILPPKCSAITPRQKGTFEKRISEFYAFTRTIGGMVSGLIAIDAASETRHPNWAARQYGSCGATPFSVRLVGSSWNGG
jgi:hypothetical protein